MNATVTSDKTRLAPTCIARDTFVVHDHVHEGAMSVEIAMNSMLIRSVEPVIVDTGVAANREHYFADLCSLIDPADIRWVIVSHDDVDHTGNVNALMELAPNATLVVSWFLQERMGATLSVPRTRQRWVGDGETLDVGDRKLLLVRPPVYDSPTTRGVYDTSTGVYWGSDAFGIPMPALVADAAELSADDVEIGMSTFARYISPWIEIADPAKFDASVDRVTALNPEVIAGCHHPVIRGALVDTAIEITRRAPSAQIIPAPDQTVLEVLQRQFVSH
jgi:flavorubredoxin